MMWWLIELINRLDDSYYHYRDKVGLGIIHSVYRTLYYEIKGREPK